MATNNALNNSSTSGFSVTGGVLSLPATTSTTGQITINGNRVLHAYQTAGFGADFFIGTNAGNFTGSSDFGGNTGCGSFSLNAITSTWASTAVGANSLLSLTSGLKNTGIGYDTLRSITTGTENAAFGHESGFDLDASASHNICINSRGVSGDDNVLRIGSGTGNGSKQLNKSFIHGIRGITTVNADAIPVLIDSAGQLGTAGGASLVQTINGDSGSATGSTITLTGGSSGAVFTGSGSTLTQSFNYLSLPAASSSAGYILSNGQLLLSLYGTNNSFIGYQSGVNSGSIGSVNCCVGFQSLRFLTSGNYNSAFGSQAMSGAGVGASISGSANTAVGASALNAVGAGSNNVGVGLSSLAGVGAVTGSNNTAIGTQSLQLLGTGSTNVAVGNNAGINYNGAESSNICINSSGTNGESNVLNIGSGTGTGAAQLNKAFVHGIRGITSGSSSDALLVMVDSNGQLATNSGLAASAYGTNNAFLGNSAGNFTTSGSGANVGVGYQSGLGLSTGDNNTFIGAFSGTGTTTGSNNVAIGSAAYYTTNGGTYNIAIGPDCMRTTSSAGASNIAMGRDTLTACTGSSNVSIGYQSGTAFTSGSANLILGTGAGSSLTTTDGSNILLNNLGVSGDNNTCRIGAATGTGTYQLNKTFIHGIFGITVGVSGIPVVVDNAGQLGTVVSSARYKENIEDMNDASSRVLDLRPVLFDYKQNHYQYKVPGLIAEEVKDVLPELVIHNKEGEVESVKYHELPVLLLNEIKKLRARIEELEAKIK